MPRSLRLVPALAFVVAVVVLALTVLLRGTSIGGEQDRPFSLGDISLIAEAQAASTTDRSDAEKAALKALESYSPDAKGLAINRGEKFVKLKEVTSKSKRLSSFSTDKPVDAWVFEVRGAATKGWKHTIGMVVVDAKTGTILSTQLLQYNE